LFTGLIEAVGKVRYLRREGDVLRISIESGLEGLRVGDSVSVDGVCQTVVSFEPPVLSCELMQETLRSTTMGKIKRGSMVNLERAMSAGDRFGGHMVTGHVDCIGRVRSISKSPSYVEIEIPAELMKYIAPKGSVAVNGVSLTVGPDIKHNRFRVFLIPHTLENTNLGSLRVGQEVNIEVDIFSRYIVNFLERRGRL